MPLELDNEDNFEALLADKRHKELKGALGEIAMSLNKDKNKDVVAAIAQQTHAINSFIELAKKEEKKEATEEKQEVKYELNQKEVVSSVSEMGAAIQQGLEAIKAILEKPEEKKEWEFKVNRGHGNLIESITAIQK